MTPGALTRPAGRCQSRVAMTGPLPFSLPSAAGAPLVIGILNVTPDSFSDGGRFADLERAVAHGGRLAAEGAALIDVGGESTRPGFAPVSAAEEAARVLPVVEALAGSLPIPVSIDTTKAAVAAAAIARGASVVNDQWGLQGDPAMADVVAGSGATAILMHNRTTIEPALTIVDDLRRFFARSLARAAQAGIPEDRLVLDPGIGFGKTSAQQATALAAIPALLAAFGRPILVGVSRKSFLGRLTGTPTDGRLPETLAANLFALEQGALLFRVHDVAAHVAAFTVHRALSTAGDRGGAP